MPASWLRRGRLARLDVSVVGGLVFFGRNVLKLAVQAVVVVHKSTHSIVAYSTSSIVRNGSSRNGLPRWNADDIAAIAHTLNTRPRKTLGWRTPAEAFSKHLHSLHQAGAARTD
jgi:hypothetical protein